MRGHNFPDGAVLLCLGQDLLESFNKYHCTASILRHPPLLLQDLCTLPPCSFSVSLPRGGWTHQLCPLLALSPLFVVESITLYGSDLSTHPLDWALP